jgi:hypothetical protein
LSPELASSCTALAARTGTPLLGVTLAVEADGQPWFAGATPLPDLRLGGDPLLDGLARALSAPGEQG